jgi:hypothetical protein
MNLPGFTAENSLSRSKFAYMSHSGSSSIPGLCPGGCPEGSICIDGSCVPLLGPPLLIPCDNPQLDNCVNQAYQLSQTIRGYNLATAITECVRQYGGGCSASFEQPTCCFPATGPEGGVCVDLWNDPNNCGSCGNECSTCTQGVCGCSPPLTSCGNGCANLSNDPQNCGSCSTVCSGPTENSTGICSNGTCVPGAFACDSGYTQCGSTCEDLNSDIQNCGGCGYACPTTPHSISICVDGNCEIRCYGDLGDTNYQPCGYPNPTCPDLLSDSENCGGCNNSCDGTECCLGTCCASGQACCNYTCTSITTDPNNCGGCGIACTGGQSCDLGVCHCVEGEEFCNGVCTPVSSDNNNCGGCGNTCTGGQLCDGGVCLCVGDEEFCNGICTPVSSDKHNCGSCGHVCTGANTCVNGVCTSPCDSCTNCHWDSFNFCWPWGDCQLCRCNGRTCLGTDCCNLGCPTGQLNCGSGCTDISTDNSNCGSCGNGCDTSGINAPYKSHCVNGVCVQESSGSG